MVWGVSATVHAGHQSALPAEAEEFLRPEMVTEMAAPAGVLDADPLPPRRRPVAAWPDVPRDHARLAGGMGEGPGPGAVSSRPDRHVLAQVLRRLRRLA